jgi:hypothetical protein
LLEFGLKGSKGLQGRPVRVGVRDTALNGLLAEPMSTMATSVVL